MVRPATPRSPPRTCPTSGRRPPLEFGGPGDAWSPEHLLLAAVQTCFLFTFRAVARASRVEFTSLTLSGEGTVSRVDGVTRFTEIVLRPRVGLPPGADRARALPGSREERDGLPGLLLSLDTGATGTRDRGGVTVNGGEVIVEYLAREKVPYVFGLCGHGNVGLLDALYDRTDAIRTISTRHEQTAGHMADAYFRVAHRPVATLTSCGPGSANLPIALACAFMDSSAFLAITGNVPTSQFNRAAFQETYRHFQADFPSVIRPYVKRSWQPTRTDMLPTALRQAFATMLGGRPGPVNLDVPFNVFKEPADVDVPEPGAWRAGISSGAAATRRRSGGRSSSCGPRGAPSSTWGTA